MLGEEPLASFAIVPEAGSIVAEYPVGCFCAADHSPDTFSIALIACVGAKVLVAFPGESWARKISDRKLPAGSIEKPLYLRVPGCLREDREQPAPNLFVNLWIGWPGLETSLDFEHGVDQFFFHCSYW